METKKLFTKPSSNIKYLGVFLVKEVKVLNYIYFKSLKKEIKKISEDGT